MEALDKFYEGPTCPEWLFGGWILGSSDRSCNCLLHRGPHRKRKVAFLPLRNRRSLESSRNNDAATAQEQDSHHDTAARLLGAPHVADTALSFAHLVPVSHNKLGRGLLPFYR